MLFDNKQVDTEELPKVEKLIFIPLEKQYLKVSIITSLIVWLFVFGGAITLYIFQGSNFPQALKMAFPIIIVFIFLVRQIYIVMGFHKKAYALRKKDIIYRTGLIWQKEITLPFNRVQHCEVNQGPLERIFNLSNLHVFTAGGSSSDLSIPGIDLITANELKAFIVKKSISDEEE